MSEEKEVVLAEAVEENQLMPWHLFYRMKIVRW